MDTSIEQIGDVAVVVLRGDHLDAGNAEALKREVAPALDSHSKVIFDMSHLQFVDSAGLGALLSCLRRLSAAGGDLKLFGMTRVVRGVFDVARMHRIFDIFPTKEEAVAAFQQ